MSTTNEATCPCPAADIPGEICACECHGPTVTLFWSDHDRACGAWVLVVKRGAYVTRTPLDGPDHPDDQAGAADAARRELAR